MQGAVIAGGAGHRRRHARVEARAGPQFGATDLVDAVAGDPVAQVRDLTDGGVHYAFEAIGLKQTAEQAFAMLRTGGTATVIGMIPVGQSVEIPGSELLEREEAPGLEHGLEPLPRRHAALRRSLPRRPAEARRAGLPRIGLDEINDGFDAMKAGEVARSVIMFE